VPLSPSQLDRIEDALEGLEDLGLDDPMLSATDDESRVVAEHLDAYRQILVLTRDAMPLEDAPLGALDGVIAAAHASVAAGDDVPAVAATPAAAEDTKSWWQRLHAAVWVPALGFAGAAALLLLVMSPGADEDEAPLVAQRDADQAKREEPAAGAAAPEQANAQKSEPGTLLDEGRIADAVPSRDAEADEDLRGAGVERRPRVRERNEDGVDPFAAADDVLGGADRGAANAEVTEEDGDLPGLALGGSAGSKSAPAKTSKSKPEPPPPPPKSAPNAAPKKKSSSKSGGAIPGGYPGATKTPVPSTPAPEPEPPAEVDDQEEQKADKGKADNKPSTKKDAVDYLAVLQRGEKARKLGKCGSAKADFNEAKASPDGKIRARALAGLGLCALSAGNEGSAESLFSQARKADGSVSSFISRERALIEGPSTAQKKTKD